MALTEIRLNIVGDRTRGPDRDFFSTEQSDCYNDYCSEYTCAIPAGRQ